MESLASAVSFARVLLSVARARKSGVLKVTTEVGRCRIEVHDGVVRAASAVDAELATVGDALLREGALDARAHAQALDATNATGLVGAWLLDRGLVTRAALEFTLRKQLRQRLARVFACTRIEAEFDENACAPCLPWIAEPPVTSELVLDAMRARVDSLPRARWLSTLPPGTFKLNDKGHALVADAALWPEEAVVVALLEQGTTTARVLQLTRHSRRAQRMLTIVALLSGLTREAARERNFSLLLRKRGELRRGARAHELLDLGLGATPKESRQALRKLAKRLHPDTLGPDADDAVRAASSVVMSALLEAERTLSDAHVRRP